MPAPGVRRVPVLVAAAGCSWEPEAVRLLERSSDLVLQRRSVDLPDLLAAAATGLARCAVVAESLAGLDADAVDRLARAGVRVVVVREPGAAPEARARLDRLGVARVLEAELTGLADAVRDLADDVEPVPVPDESGPGDRARIVVVWGPAGAPGRTTLACALAAESAARGRATLLLDADPYGGAVAQHLGVLDEVSGLLAAARLANAGRLDLPGLADAARGVAENLRVLTGLPRADRWAEIRPAAFADLLDVATTLVEQVVVDVGFSLEDAASDPFAAAPRRHEMTLAALDRADDVVVVGSADPVGLSRLARGLVELRDVLPLASLHVVVNRTRSSLGWSQAEVGAMIESFVRPLHIHYLPEDRATADRALTSGSSLVELGDSPLRRGVAEVADPLFGAAVGAPVRSWRPARPRGGLRRAQAPKSR